LSHGDHCKTFARVWQGWQDALTENGGLRDGLRLGQGDRILYGFQ
jgi:hypothetical protein